MEDNRKLPGYGNLSVADERVAATAGEIMADFCNWYTPEEVQEELLDLLLAAINSEEADNWNSAVRGEFIFLYRQLVKLAGAVYMVRKSDPEEAGPVK